MQISFIFLIIYLFAFLTGISQTSRQFISDSFDIESTSIEAESEILISYLKIPSESGNEKMAGEFFRNLCLQRGLFITQFGDTNGQFNFAASLYPLEMKKPNLIFINHIDVVSSGELKKWMHPPLEGRLINDEIWGRGAFDNKGMAVIQLSTVSNFIQRSKVEDFPFNITILSLSCEETQCKGGVRYVIENFMDDLNPWVVIGEGPPALQGIIPSKPEEFIFGIATSQKKALWLKLELSLASNAHSSVTPLEYSNKDMVLALQKLIQNKPKIKFIPENRALLKELAEMESGIKSFALKHPKLFKPIISKQLRKKPEIAALFTNTITVTNIHNPGIAHNSIPSKTTILLDCRLLPKTDVQLFISEIKRTLNDDRITLETIFEAPSAESSDKNHIVYQTLQHSIKKYFGEESKVIPLFLPNLTDSNWFRSKGIPVFDISPFKIKRELLNCIHGYDERIPVSALKEGKVVFTMMISSLLDQAGTKPINFLVRP